MLQEPKRRSLPNGWDDTEPVVAVGPLLLFLKDVGSSSPKRTFFFKDAILAGRL
jgi:hypothetical protein